MGGQTCSIIIHALVRFNSVPTDPAKLSAFDSQMRECFANDTIAQAIVNDTDDAKEICAILQKSSWTGTDRNKLWMSLAGYMSYS